MYVAQDGPGGVGVTMVEVGGAGDGREVMPEGPRVAQQHYGGVPLSMEMGQYVNQQYSIGNSAKKTQTQNTQLL